MSQLGTVRTPRERTAETKASHGSPAGADKYLMIFEPAGSYPVPGSCSHVHATPVTLSPRQCFEKPSGPVSSQPRCFFRTFVEQLDTLAEVRASRIGSFGGSDTGVCIVTASNTHVEAVVVSWPWPPRMLLFLTIESFGVAISWLGFTQTKFKATPVPRRVVPLRPRASGACCCLRHAVLSFDTCKASRHPLCCYSVLASLSHLLGAWSFDRSIHWGASLLGQATIDCNT